MSFRTPKVIHRARLRSQEEEEEAKKKAQYQEKLKAKSNLVRAEFEKHKKKLLLSVSEASKANEAKLRCEVNDLVASNTKKLNTLNKLVEINERLQQEVEDNDTFISTMTKCEAKSSEENIYASMEFQSNRRTAYLSIKEKDPEVLGEKLADLREVWDDIERISGLEEENEAAIKDKLEELTVNHHLLTRQVKDLEMLNNHFDKRFSYIRGINYIAQNKYGTAVNNLTEIKDLTKDLKTKEKAFKKEKYSQKDNEEMALQERQAQMANVLVSLDEKKVEVVHVAEHLKKVEIKYEQMIEKRKYTKAIGEQSMLLDHLYNVFFNPNPTKEVLDAILKPKDDEKTTFSTEESIDKGHRMSRKISTLSKRENPSPQEASAIDRNYYLAKIEQFYNKYPEGPEKVVSELCKLYTEYFFKEASLKKMFDEYQSEKLKKETQLNRLKQELESLVDPAEAAHALDPNEAPDAGIFVIDDEETTLNQAKFIFENKKDADSEISNIRFYEVFILRCYLDSMEMMNRLGKLLVSMADHSDYSVPEKLRRLGREVLQHVSLFRKVKKGTLITQQDMVTPKHLEIGTQATRTYTGNSLQSEKDIEYVIAIDLNETYQAFVSAFKGFPSKATEFVNRLRQDTMIGSFIKLEDVQEYLEKYQTGGSDLEQQTDKALADTHKLRRKAIENMLKKLEKTFNFFTDTIENLTIFKDECAAFLNQRNQNVDVDFIATDKQTEFVKSAWKKNWDFLYEKYKYDPTINYLNPSVHMEFPEPSKRDNHQKKSESKMEPEHKEEEILNAEDLKNKLEEVTRLALCKSGGRTYGDGTAFLSKTKQEEEQKRILIKKKKEQMKKVLYNMSEEEFLDWQRKQMKQGEEPIPVIPPHDDGHNFLKPTTSQSQRLSHTTPLQGLRKMIENAKLLSKINILERHKSPPNDLKTLKFEVLGNYIPADPIKVPRSTVSSPKKSFKPLMFTNFGTPRTQTSNPTNGRPFAASYRSSPTSEAADSTNNDYYYRPNIQFTSTPLSKFKNMPASQSQSEIKFEYDGIKKDQKAQEKVSKSAFVGIKRSLHMKSQSQKIVSKEDLGVEKTNQLKNKNKKKLNTLLKYNVGKFPEIEGLQIHSAKAKSSSTIELPKLKKKKKVVKVPNLKQKRQSLPDTFEDTNDLCMQLNVLGDPMVKGVYAPSFFSSNFLVPSNDEDIRFHIGSSNNKTSLLVSPEVQ